MDNVDDNDDVEKWTLWLMRRIGCSRAAADALMAGTAEIVYTDRKHCTTVPSLPSGNA